MSSFATYKQTSDLCLLLCVSFYPVQKHGTLRTEYVRRHPVFVDCCLSIIGRICWVNFLPKVRRKVLGLSIKSLKGYWMCIDLHCHTVGWRWWNPKDSVMEFWFEITCSRDALHPRVHLLVRIHTHVHKLTLLDLHVHGFLSCISPLCTASVVLRNKGHISCILATVRVTVACSGFVLNIVVCCELYFTLTLAFTTSYLGYRGLQFQLVCLWIIRNYECTASRAMIDLSMTLSGRPCEF